LILEKVLHGVPGKLIGIFERFYKSLLFKLVEVFLPDKRFQLCESLLIIRKALFPANVRG